MKEQDISGWYELSKSSNGQFKFVLNAGKLYTGSSGAKNSFESVQKNSLDESKFARETAKNNNHISISKLLIIRLLALAKCILVFPLEITGSAP